MTDEIPRYQPEFSTGERLSALESQIRTLTSAQEHAELKAAMEGHWRLDKATEQAGREEIQALRRELELAIVSQREAILKAESAQSRQADLTREQAEKREAVSNERLLALERGSSKGEGLEQRSQQINAAMMGWAAVIVVGIGIIVAIIVKA